MFTDLCIINVIIRPFPDKKGKNEKDILEIC
jgi:hypothetical protein